MRGVEKYRMILDAAKQVFARVGFYNSKVSEIARAAHVADGTIYLYFKNKDDILISLFEDELSRIIEEVRIELKAIDDPAAKLTRFCELHLGLVESDRALAEVIQVELRQSNKFMREYKNKRFMLYIGLIAEIVTEGQGRAVFKAEVNPEIATHMLFGALDELSTYMVMAKRKHFDVKQLAATVAAVFIDGIAA